MGDRVPNISVMKTASRPTGSEAPMADYHSHATFSDEAASAEQRIQAEDEHFRSQQVAGVTVVSLTRSAVPQFESDMRAFHSAPPSHLIGRAIEGPLLLKPGGTPREAAWQPTPVELDRILSTRPSYVVCPVLSKDLIQRFAHHRVNLCFGHLSNTAADADRLTESCLYARSLGLAVLADHFMNDMAIPESFAYHQRRAPRHGDVALSADKLRQSSLHSCEGLLGPVPARLLQLAQTRYILPMINVDGLHVDYHVVSAILSLVPANHFLPMTDYLRHGQLGPVTNRYENGLYWNDAGQVAGGTHDLRSARLRMQESGHFTTAQVDDLFAYRPLPGFKAYCP